MPVSRISAKTQLFESAKRSVPTRSGARVYRGVTLIRAGLGNSRDKNYYPAETLERAVKEGKFESMKAFVDHPDSLSEEVQPERSVRDIAGVYENARWNPSHKTVEADLRILKANGWLADTIDELIESGHAKQIGLSINGRGKTEPARRRLEEAGGEEVDVNEVKDFIELRSTDIVTEAGAGGGFAAALLESRRRAQETTPMARRSAAAKALKLIKDGKVTEAQAVLEAAAAPAAPAAKVPVRTTTRTKTVEPVAIEDDDREDEDDEDAKEALDEAADTIKRTAHASAEAEPEDTEDEDEEELDSTEEDGEEDSEEDGEEDSEDEPTARAAAPSFASARDRFRAHAAAPAREANTKRKIIGATGTTGTVNGSGSFNKRDSYKRKGKKVGTKSTMGFKKVKPGAQFSPTRESAAGDRVGLLRENAALRRENQKLAGKNESLAEALNTYRSTDVASRMLHESDVPARLQPSLLRQMIGMTRTEMQQFIDGEVERINVIAESVGGRIEGAGTSLREAAFMSGDSGQDATSVLSRYVPLKR